MASIADRPHEELFAVEVRHRFNLGHGKVDPVKVAELLGLEVVRYPIEDGSLEGIYRPLPGGGAILVNSRSQNLRQRFTVAHEIGHFLLHTDQAFIDEKIEEAQNDRPDKLKEREADRFAGALLVDRDAAEEMFHRHRGDLDAAVAEVADTFGVNVPTAAIQIEQYGFITRDECDAFQAEYAQVPLWEFMERHGRRSSHRKGDGQLSISRSYKNRVTAALATGLLSPERAAELLNTSVESLPKSALAKRERILAPLHQDVVYDRSE